MPEQSPKYIPIDALRAESGSEELVNSESMKPYMPKWEDVIPAEPSPLSLPYP